MLEWVYGGLGGSRVGIGRIGLCWRGYREGGGG